jgi:hypothetical protein
MVWSLPSSLSAGRHGHRLKLQRWTVKCRLWPPNLDEFFDPAVLLFWTASQVSFPETIGFGAKVNPY